MNENLFVSPCIGTCTIDQNTQQCIGCGRTLEEISKWTQLSDVEKMIVMKRLGYGKRKKRKRLQKKAMK